jgi:hypothetical protein
MKALLVPIATIAMLKAASAPGGAESGSPPQPSCLPRLGPCEEADQFGELSFLGAPLRGCKTQAGWAVITTIGNGMTTACTSTWGATEEWAEGHRHSRNRLGGGFRLMEEFR